MGWNYHEYLCNLHYTLFRVKIYKIALNYEFQIDENRRKSYDNKQLIQIVKTSKQFEGNENLSYW